MLRLCFTAQLYPANMSLPPFLISSQSLGSEVERASIHGIGRQWWWGMFCYFFPKLLIDRFGRSLTTDDDKLIPNEHTYTYILRIL